jgi:uncharacterized membrane protein YdbT with pleckstrin-like domain
MARYIEQILTDGERVVFDARVSLWSQWKPIALGIVLLPVVGIGLVFLLRAWLVYRTTELAITTKRIVSKTGIIRRSTMELRLDKIESIKVDQHIMGRLLNFGSITLAGTGGDKTPIECISAPLEFQRHFMTATEQGRASHQGAGGY